MMNHEKYFLSITGFLILIVSAFPISSKAFTDEELQSALSEFCENNKKDYLVYQSFPCKLARDKLSISPLCDAVARMNTRKELELDEIARVYSKVKGKDFESVKAEMCLTANAARTEKNRPMCDSEASGGEKIGRRWWNGNSWTSTSVSLQEVTDSAESGDTLAQFNLGSWFMFGSKCIDRNEESAVKWLCQSHDHGNPMATMQLDSIGSRYGMTGTIAKYETVPSGHRARDFLGKKYGCTPTKRQAFIDAYEATLDKQFQSNLRKAKQGNTSAMYSVATELLSKALKEPNDADMEKVYLQAFDWFSKAASKGHVEAMSALAGMYNRGDGVTEDNIKAFQWTKKAAEKGDLDAQLFLGLLYRDGTGTERDLKKSVLWLAKAMDRGNQTAVETLNEMFFTGELQAAQFQAIHDRLRAIERRMPASK